MCKKPEQLAVLERGGISVNGDTSVSAVEIAG